MFRVRFDLPMTRRYRVHTITSPDGQSIYSFKSVREVMVRLTELGQTKFVMVTDPPHGLIVTIGPYARPIPEIAPQASGT